MNSADNVNAQEQKFINAQAMRTRARDPLSRKQRAIPNINRAVSPRVLNCPRP